MDIKTRPPIIRYIVYLTWHLALPDYDGAPETMNYSGTPTRVHSLRLTYTYEDGVWLIESWGGTHYRIKNDGNPYASGDPLRYSIDKEPWFKDLVDEHRPTHVAIAITES